MAHIGNRQSFGEYLCSYERAVERLFVAVERNEDPVDLIAPPLLFLMRHTIELGYKFTLSKLHEMNGEPYDAKGYGNHKLHELHKSLRLQYEKAVRKYELSDQEVDNFNEYYAKTECGMRQFESLDAGAISFRYPTDKAGRANLPLNQKVDILALKQTFDDAMVLLLHTASIVGEYADIDTYMTADFTG